MGVQLITHGREKRISEWGKEKKISEQKREKKKFQHIHRI